jgi:hypothetical protein
LWKGRWQRFHWAKGEREFPIVADGNPSLVPTLGSSFKLMDWQGIEKFVSDY